MMRHSRLHPLTPHEADESMIAPTARTKVLEEVSAFTQPSHTRLYSPDTCGFN